MSSEKKLLERSVWGNITIPLGVILLGALIIFGVTKLLSTEKDHRDLIREMQTKTFGNRWVAAFELSKLLASSRIPPEEIPWVIENLHLAYQTTDDQRTKNFVIMALGALKSPLTIPALQEALESGDNQIQFNALVALGNMPQDVEVNWPKVSEFLKSQDAGLRHVATFALASHHIAGAEKEILLLLNDPEMNVRYAAATALIYYKQSEAVPILKEILLLEPSNQVSGPGQESIGFNDRQIESLKLNVLNALAAEKWNALESILEEVVIKEKNIKVATKAKEVLTILKK